MKLIISVLGLYLQVQAGDSTAKAVKEGYHTFCQSGTVLADSAMLIAQTEPMQLASIGEGGQDSNHLAIRLLEGETVLPGYMGSFKQLHDQLMALRSASFVPSLCL